MYIRAFFIAVSCLIANQAFAMTLNVEFSRSWYHVDLDYVSPAGEQTAGYWNTAVATSPEQLRERSGVFAGVLANYAVPSGGNSYFGGNDYYDPNIGLGDAHGARGFHYTMTGLSDGQYDLFLYARLATNIFSAAGVDLVPVSVTNLVGEIFTYVYSVDVSGGSLDLRNTAQVTWIAGLQLTDDPVPNTVPLPGTVWLVLAGIGGLPAFMRYFAS